MLNTKEKLKYQRQLLLPEIGMSGQLKLQQAKVLVVGAGGLGCPVLQYLTAAGIGQIGIIDFDLVEESNLQRQVLYHENDIGKPKAVVAVEKLRLLNQEIQLTGYQESLNINNVAILFGAYDLVVDCTDNFGTRYLINDACVLLGKPFVYGAIDRFEGQVAVFNLNPNGNKKSPTYRYLFPTPPPPGMVKNCEEAGVLGVLPGIIGSMQALEVIKIITGIGAVLDGKIFCYDALKNNTHIFEIAYDNATKAITPQSFDEMSQLDYTFDCITGNGVQEITPLEVQSWLAQNKSIQFVDVRNPEETPEIGALRGFKIQPKDIVHQIDNLRKEDLVIVYCKSGIRSAAVAQELQTVHAFKQVHSLKGGVTAWLETMPETANK